LIQRVGGLESRFCKYCGEHRPVGDFKKHNTKCRDCRNADQRAARAASNDSATKRYEKSFNGYLMRTYRNMKSRVSGILKKKAHLYEGLEILSKESFYTWAKSDDEYSRLYEQWVGSGYEYRLAPSIDRIDSSKGYILENMRWLPHWKNSQLGNQSGHAKRNRLTAP